MRAASLKTFVLFVPVWTESIHCKGSVILSEIRMLLCMCVSSVFTMLLLHYSNSFCLHYFTIAKQVCVCVCVCACACACVCVCVCVCVSYSHNVDLIPKGLF